MNIIVNNWQLSPSLNAVIHCESGEERRLGEFHYLLLELLIAHADDVLSRDYLMTKVWKNRVVGSNSLPTAIHALRLALGDDGKQQEIIKTIPKKGYLLSKEYLVLREDNVTDVLSGDDVDKDIDLNDTEDSLSTVAQDVLEITEQSDINLKKNDPKTWRHIAKKHILIVTLTLLALSLILLVTEWIRLNEIEEKDTMISAQHVCVTDVSKTKLLEK